MQKRKYHFVKFTKDGIWYLKPECLDDVKEHFKKIFGQEIKEGVRDFVSSRHVYKNWMGKGEDFVYDEHPTTPWNSAVSIMNDIYKESWILTGCRLENEVINNRIDYFNRGMKCFYPEGVACYCNMDDNGTYYAEAWKDELVYPTETVTLDDVRYMQWNMLGNKGEHWYAKVGKRDVYDNEGNMKWNSKAEAEQAAKWFIEQTSAAFS